MLNVFEGAGADVMSRDFGGTDGGRGLRSAGETRRLKLVVQALGGEISVLFRNPLLQPHVGLDHELSHGKFASSCFHLYYATDGLGRGGLRVGFRAGGWSG